MHCINELCYMLIFQFPIFLSSYILQTKKTLIPSLAQKLQKLSMIMGQINISLRWDIKDEEMIMGQINIPLRWDIKDEERMEKLYITTLICLDEFNANFVLLYFSSYSSIKI